MKQHQYPTHWTTCQGSDTPPRLPSCRAYSAAAACRRSGRHSRRTCPAAHTSTPHPPWANFGTLGRVAGGGRTHHGPLAARPMHHAYATKDDTYRPRQDQNTVLVAPQRLQPARRSHPCCLCFLVVPPVHPCTPCYQCASSPRIQPAVSQQQHERWSVPLPHHHSTNEPALATSAQSTSQPVCFCTSPPTPSDTATPPLLSRPPAFLLAVLLARTAISGVVSTRKSNMPLFFPCAFHVRAPRKHSTMLHTLRASCIFVFGWF